MEIDRFIPIAKACIERAAERSASAPTRVGLIAWEEVDKLLTVIEHEELKATQWQRKQPHKRRRETV